jgi:hypothetical protein
MLFLLLTSLLDVLVPKLRVSGVFGMQYVSTMTPILLS